MIHPHPEVQVLTQVSESSLSYVCTCDSEHPLRPLTSPPEHELSAAWKHGLGSYMEKRQTSYDTTYMWNLKKKRYK